MIYEKHENAKLTDYLGPFFPDRIDELNEAYDFNGWDDEAIASIAKNLLTTGRRTGLLTTSDHYQWADGIILDYPEGKVFILIPRLKDHAGIDRSIAFYAKGNIQPEHIDAVLNVIIQFAKTLS